MAETRRGVPASQLARDCGVDLADFTDKIDALLTRLSVIEATMSIPERRREICTAVWAAIQASFEASKLSPVERDGVLPLLQKMLIPYWQEHCAGAARMADWLADHASNYLDGSERNSQVATAGAIVTRLLNTIGTAERLKAPLARALIPMFAHRMLGDVEHISDIKARLGIQLPVIAVLCATLAAYEPALRVLRLC